MKPLTTKPDPIPNVPTHPEVALWLIENHAALAAYNDWVAKNGLPLEMYRQF